jgi:hypothetical protein
VINRFQIRHGLAVWEHWTAHAESEAARQLAATRAAQAALMPPDAGDSGDSAFLWALRGAVHERQADQARALAAQAAREETAWRDAHRLHQQADRVIERLRTRHTTAARRKARRLLEGGSA